MHFPLRPLHCHLALVYPMVVACSPSYVHVAVHRHLTRFYLSATSVPFKCRCTTPAPPLRTLCGAAINTREMLSVALIGIINLYELRKGAERIRMEENRMQRHVTTKLRQNRPEQNVS